MRLYPDLQGGNVVATRYGMFRDGKGPPPALRRALPLPEARLTSLMRDGRNDCYTIFVEWELLGRSTTLRHQVDDPDQLEDEGWWRAQQCEAARVIKHQYNEMGVLRFEQTR